MLRNSSHCTPGNCLLKRTLRDRAPGEKLLDLSGRTVKINTSPLFAANGEVEYVMVCLATFRSSPAKTGSSPPSSDRTA